jgi:paraquat-inducible protein B
VSSDRPPDAPSETAPIEKPGAAARLRQARAKLAMWPGVVWAIPVAALLIVVYLGLGALANQGFDVIVTFPSAAGARPDDTKVVYKGVEVGHVTRVSLNPDARRVDLKLHLDNTLRPVIGGSTRFWLIGANPSFSDLNSLKAAVSGLSIGVAPGPGARTHRFVGLDQDPIVDPGTPGRSFWLDINLVSAVRRGANISYHGDDVGRVTDVQATGPRSFRAQIFLRAPFDQYLKPSSYFWQANPVQISLGSDGITGQFSPSAAFSGGIAFDTPVDDMDEPPSPTGAHFDLFTSQSSAQQGADGPPVFYTTTFSGAAGELQVGAPVLLKGSRIGFVESVGVTFDPDTAAVTNPVVFAVFPQRLHVKGIDPAVIAPTEDGWRPVADRAVSSLVRHGYRANISQNPPIIGAHNLVFDKITGPGRADIAHTGGYPSVPAATGSDAGSLSDKADALLTKLNAVPIEAIGNDVRQITLRLKTLVSSPKIDDSIDHLNQTLKSVDDITADVKPKIGPLIDKLNQTADQLQQTATAANGVMTGTGGPQDANLPAAIKQVTDAARSVRGLADYLERHPEAIIKGKVKE